MRKRKKGRKFSRETDQRKALVKSLMRALFSHEKIRTTEAKAKGIAGLSEKLITLAKKGGLAQRRRLLAYFSPQIVKKLISEIGPRYKERNGGYTRITKLGQRRSDGAKMAQIELIK